MNVSIISEHGYEEAILGLSLSFNQPIEKMHDVASKLAGKGDGHDKFLRQMIAWIDITAPRYWWTQFDTYRIGVEKCSESTMHTIMKQKLTQRDFEGQLPEQILDILNELIQDREFQAIKHILPESFLQRRIVMMSYEAISRVLRQRQNHRLSHEWGIFAEAMKDLHLYEDFIG